MTLNESIIEDATLTWFGELGYAVGHGPHLANLRDTLLLKLLSGEWSMTANLLASTKS